MELKTAPSQNGFAALLQYPDFLKVWFGRTISRFGDALDSIAFMWLMYKLTGSTLLMGTVMAVSFIPSLFGMAAGVLVDRMDKKKVMIYMDLLRGVSTASIALLYMSGGLSVWALYCFAFFNSVCEIFSAPARSSASQVLVNKQHYMIANSLNQASGAMAEMFGTGLAAVIIGLTGIGPAFLIDSATFLISALTAKIANIKTEVKKNGSLNFSKFLIELKEGLVIIRSNTLIFINILMGCAINLLLAPFNVLMPVYSDKVLGAGEKGYSLMGISILIGTLLGSLVIGQIGHRFKKSTMITGGFLIFGIGIGSLGIMNNLFLAAIFCALSGFSIPVITAAGMSVVQEYTPKEKMGRVSSTLSTLSLMGMPLGFAISGAIGQSLNVQLTYMLVGVLIVLICIPPLFNKEFRSI